MAETTPYRASNPDLVIVPLRSDPPWLSTGLLGVTVGCVALVMLYVALLPSPRPALGLAIIPGLAIATFAGSYLGWWGRRRGGTMALEAVPERVTLRETSRREELVDRVAPFGAVLLRDSSTGRRLVLLSQNGEPVTVMDTARTTASPPPAWAPRTIDLDLSSVAISPSTAHVLTVAVTGSVDPLLATLERDLSDASPLVSYPLPSGEVLLVLGDELRLGSRVAPYATTTARRITITTPAGDSQAISLLAGETNLLLARHEVSEAGGDPQAQRSEAPDAYLPALVYELVASRFRILAAAPDGTARV